MPCIIRFFVFGTIILSSSVFAQKANFSDSDFSKLRPLAGIWKMEKEGGYLFEAWRKVDASRMTGSSYWIKGAEKKELESVRLFFQEGEIVYAPTAFGENQGQEVSFTLKQIVNGQFIFENLKHDFPRIISYNLIGKDSLYANIEGEIDGKLKRIDFKYVRQK